MIVWDIDVYAALVLTCGLMLCSSSVCADMVWKEHSQVTGALTPEEIAGMGNPGSACFNGDVVMGFGQAEFIGLGVSVMVMLVFVELFGSVFMK